MVGFARISDFPSVTGAIDGTHIPIKAPSLNGKVFFNTKKNYHSINVMAMCDSNSIFINLVAKSPGLSHDASVWSNAALCEIFESGNTASC